MSYRIRKLFNDEKCGFCKRPKEDVQIIWMSMGICNDPYFICERCLKGLYIKKAEERGEENVVKELKYRWRFY